jgi:hypothetical protein
MKLLLQRLAGRLNPITREYSATSAIVKGSKGHFTIDTGPTINEIEFITTNVTNAEAGLVTFYVELENDTIIELTGAEIHKYLRDFNKREVEVGRFTIPLSDMQYRTKEGIQSSELVTLPADRLIIHVKFDNAIAHANPGIRVRLRQTPAQQFRYFIPRIYSSSFDLLQSGRTKWRFPRAGTDKFIRRIHFAKAGIDAVNVFQSDKPQNEMLKADNDYDLVNIGKKAPQANTFSVDGTMYGFGLDGLQPVINKLEYQLDVQASGKCDFFVEMLEQVRDLPVLQA